MTFDDLYQLAATARQTRAFVINIADFAPAAVANFQRTLDGVRLTLSQVEVAELVPNEMRLRGTAQIGIRVECELRFYREGQGIGYALTFATKRPLDLLKGDLRHVADLVDIEAFWWTASSRAIEEVDVAIRGLEAKALRIREGFDNFHLKLDSAVLDFLTLGDAIFEVALTGNIPRFSVAKRLSFALPPVLKAKFERITVTGDGTVTFESEVVLKLLGAEIPPIPLLLALAPTRIAIRLPVPNLPAIPQGIPFQAVTLRESFAEMNGTLGSSKYGVAMDGKYILPGGSGHGGTYRLEYTGGNTSPIPDTIELSIDMLTLSDILNLMTPVPVRLPGGIDRLIVLRNGYAYYAAGPGARSANGVLLEQGVSARASVTVFGAPSYFAADVRSQGFRIKILLNPLRLGNILALRGTGVQPPAQYAGPRFANDAIGFELDTIAGTAKAAVIVDFLGSTIQQIEGRIEQSGMAIKSRTTLPGLGEVPLAILAGERGLSVKGGFEFRQSLDLPIDYGFHLRGAAKISGSFEAAGAVGTAPVTQVNAALEMLGFSVSTTFSIDPNDLRNLAERILQELYDAARRKLLDAVALVKSFLDGALHYTQAAAEAGRKLVAYLADKFEATAAEVISIMKRAGATAQQALDLVRQGAEALGRFALDTVVNAVRTLYSALEALNTLRQWAEQFGETIVEYAENFAWLLRQGGYVGATVAEEAWRYLQNLENRAEAFVRALTWGGFKPSEVALQLRSRGIGVDAAAKLIGPVFGTDILQAALSPAYGVSEATRVATNVINEMGRFSRNITDELSRFGRRLGFPW